MATNSSARQSNQSSSRLLLILEKIAENRFPVRLQDIAKQTGMTQSTVLRYLYALEDANYIYQESDTLRYAMTWRACRLSKNLDSLESLRNIVRPFLHQLYDTFSLGISLVINQKESSLYIDCIDDPNYPTDQAIGKVLPLHATGAGKVMMSEYTEQQLQSYIANRGLTRWTEKTIVDPELLKKELEHIRLSGFAIDDEEYARGLRCVSFPLRDYNASIVAAVSIFGNHYNLTDDRIYQDIYPQMKAVTDTISSRLGYR